MEDKEIKEIKKEENEDEFDNLALEMKPAIISRANKLGQSYYFVDKDELIQAGLIGLYNGVKHYDPTKNVPLTPFVNLCIKREMFNSIRKQRRAFYDDNGKPILSLQGKLNDDNITLEDYIPDKKADPHSNAIDKVILEEIIAGISKDKIEVMITLLHAYGYSYKEMSEMLGVSKKKIDNVLQKIRKKVSYLFD